MKGIKQIKNYRLLRQIGKGAVGVVYEAVDDTTNKKYAIKSIPNKSLESGRAMDNLKRELKLLHGLNHPNIIKITGLEKTVNNIYLVLEYCNGGNLYEYSTFYKNTYKKPLPEEDVQKILRQLLKGLEYMHNSKAIHRDIKLENILINFNDVPNIAVKGKEQENLVDYKNVQLDNFTVKIADLGYARDLGVSEVASTICGTPITMAPDIVNLFDKSKKDQKYNSKVDLWSLGTIAYELLIGAPPFYARNYQELFEAVMKGVYNLPKSLRISLEAITFINGLLQFYPEKRFDWDAIKKHPFIVNDSKTFHFIDLNALEANAFSSPESLEVNTKNCENFVWLMYKMTNKDFPLDKLDETTFMNAKVEESEFYEDANELNIGEPEEHDHITKYDTSKPEITLDEDLNGTRNDYIPENYNRDGGRVNILVDEYTIEVIDEKRDSKALNKDFFEIKLRDDKDSFNNEIKKSGNDIERGTPAMKIINEEDLIDNDQVKLGMG
jgi:serine/threonine protein kinase